MRIVSISLTASVCALVFFLVSIPALFAQEQISSSKIIYKLKVQLDLSDYQINNITPIIDKYVVAFHELQRSIEDGSANPSTTQDQRQQLEAQETQDISQYLKPYQLTGWRSLQSQLYQQDNSENNEENEQADKYSNLPGN
ncbi:MAG: hypothetical protein HQL13_07360 [Candidatus Omnitrophica bacterium]|nr:hypothetical protein [Candidatus Omnitrophota bacterium]